MKKIKECKLALMEKDKDFSIGDKGKGNYIIRTSGAFSPEDYLKTILIGEYEGHIPTDDEYNTLIESAVRDLYDTLMDRSEHKYETVGLWFIFEDGTILDNAMDILVMETIKEYGEGNVIPIVEFTKMTLQAINESEESI